MKHELYLNSVSNVKEVVTALQLRTSPRFFSSSKVYLHLVINIYLHSPPSTPWRPGCPCPGPCSTAGTPSAPRSTWSRGRTSRTPATWHTAASHVDTWHITTTHLATSQQYFIVTVIYSVNQKGLCCADFLGKWLYIIWHLHHVTIVAMIIFGQMKGRLRCRGEDTSINVAMAQFARLEEMVFANVPICQPAPAHNIVVVCAIVHLSSQHFSSKQPFKRYLRVDIYTFLYFCINISCFFIFIFNTSAPMSIIWDTRALLLCSCV